MASFPTFSIPVEIHRYRVLFTDGEVEDYLAEVDNSETRTYILTRHFEKTKGVEKTKGMIVGVIDLGVASIHTPSPNQ